MNTGTEAMDDVNNKGKRIAEELIRLCSREHLAPADLERHLFHNELVSVMCATGCMARKKRKSTNQHIQQYCQAKNGQVLGWAIAKIDRLLGCSLRNSNQENRIHRLESNSNNALEALRMKQSKNDQYSIYQDGAAALDQLLGELKR